MCSDPVYSILSTDTEYICLYIFQKYFSKTETWKVNVCNSSSRWILFWSNDATWASNENCDAFILRLSVDGSLCSAIKTTTASRGGDYQVLLFIYTQTAAAGGNAQSTSCVPDKYFHEKLTVGLVAHHVTRLTMWGWVTVTDPNSTNSVTTKAQSSPPKGGQENNSVGQTPRQHNAAFLCHMLDSWIR